MRVAAKGGLTRAICFDSQAYRGNFCGCIWSMLVGPFVSRVDDSPLGVGTLKVFAFYFYKLVSYREIVMYNLQFFIIIIIIIIIIHLDLTKEPSVIRV